ncbi:MAG: HlyD family efflux transporter periplasmic adaptor subunit [Planctomycetes bacterium]|nr:HlyD family efflux transporter periplasmic adaptor subunit [Planctomycetota bacterium]
MLIALAVTLLGTAGLFAWHGNPFAEKTEEPTNLLFETVKRGPLEITITERGNLESANNDQIICMVEGEQGTGILKILEEGSRVKAGDLLVELDSSKLKNDLTAQEITLEQASANLKTAEKNLEIQETQNESDIAAVKLKIELADLDLEKYKEGDYIQEKDTVKGEIELATEDVTRAEDKYAFTKRLAKKGYAKQSEVEADRVSLQKARINLQVAEMKMDVLERYTKGRKEAELDANAKEYKRELERVELKAKATQAKYEADLKAAQKTYEVEKSKYDKIIEQIKLCKIYAKRDGMVVYVNQRAGGFRGSSEPLIYEGAKVKERQPIINLPDVTNMQVNARIHESKIAMVRVGLPCTIHLDAQAGETFRGEVANVAAVSTSGNWPNINLKEYVTLIKLTDDVEKVSQLKPGMTAEIEILIDRLTDVLQAPVQSFVERGGRHFVWVMADGKVTRKEVKVGKPNDQFMEIVDGLKEGEKLVQTPRVALPKEIALLEADVPANVESATTGLKAPPLPPAGGAPGAGPGGARGGRGGPPGSAGGEGGGAPMAGGAGRGAGGGGFDPEAIFARLDKNGDGKIAPDEADDRMKDRFSQLDTDGDKFIQKAEFLKAMEAMRAARGGAGGPPGGGAGGGQ